MINIDTIKHVIFSALFIDILMPTSSTAKAQKQGHKNLLLPWILASLIPKVNVSVKKKVHLRDVKEKTY